MNNRRRLSWILAVPLMVAGSTAAHSMGSLLSAPAVAAGADRDGGAELARRADHGYVTSLPVIAGLLIAIAIIGLGVHVHRAARGGRDMRTSPVWFIALPPLGFAIQEVVERLLHAESLPFNPAHEPAFLIALLLQVPFGFLAFLLGRMLLALGARMARALSGSGPPWQPGRPASASLPRQTIPLRIATFSLGHSVRGPPAIALSS
jgi:tellurite resistance protein TehA-like permease